MNVMAETAEDAVDGAKTILEGTNPDLAATITEIVAEEYSNKKHSVN